MSDAIQVDAIITSVSSKADGSLGLRVCTPELDSQAKAAFMDLQNKNLKLLIQPLDEPAPRLIKIDRELGTKTPSQRLRGVLFIKYKQSSQQEQVTFEQFYANEMNNMIENIKRQLEPSPF